MGAEGSGQTPIWKSELAPDCTQPGSNKLARSCWVVWSFSSFSRGASLNSRAGPVPACGPGPPGSPRDWKYHHLLVSGGWRAQGPAPLPHEVEGFSGQQAVPTVWTGERSWPVCPWPAQLSSRQQVSTFPHSQGLFSSDRRTENDTSLSHMAKSWLSSGKLYPLAQYGTCSQIPPEQ